MQQPRIKTILIAGGGIGGLATALACSGAGLTVKLFERASEFSAFGAGIQLGPNVMQVLDGWGLRTNLSAVITLPERLQVRCAISGAELGCLRLGNTMRERYGWPYATIHRADLHALLLSAARAAGAVLNLSSEVSGLEQRDGAVRLLLSAGRQADGDVLVGADGVASQVRQCLLADGAPRASGHVAYRALVAQDDLPPALRSHQVTIWLGPRLHAVQYPVRAGQSLNLVVIIEGDASDALDDWNRQASSADLRNQLVGCHGALLNLVECVSQWRKWSLYARSPMRGASEQVRGRVALVGDAAHPMLPYLAQGAAMAIEDALELSRMLSVGSANALQRFAARRWQRNARVQARSLRNGRIFHASGLLRWGRDTAMQLLGESVLDLPWLYAGLR